MVPFITLERIPQGPFELGRSLCGDLTTTLLRLLLLATIKLKAGVFPEDSNMVLQRIPRWRGLALYGKSVHESIDIHRASVRTLDQSPCKPWRALQSGRKLHQEETPGVSFA